MSTTKAVDLIYDFANTFRGKRVMKFLTLVAERDGLEKALIVAMVLGRRFRAPKRQNISNN